MKKVLILGHGTRSFLSVIRSLGRKGFIVHVANSLPEDLALCSKYITEYFLLPPFSDAERWKSEVISIVKKGNYDLVIPTDDSPIILLYQIKSEIERDSRVYLLDTYAYTVTSNKLQTYSFCRSLGIRVPRFLMLSEGDDPEGILKEFTFPLILKPMSSFSPDNLERKKLVRIAWDKETFFLILKDLFRNNSALIVQEYFEGDGIGVEILACRGEILAAFQHIRIHEKRIWGIRNIGGASTYRKSQPVDPILMSQAAKIIRGLDYTGVAMLEFRKNFEKNESVFIEINGRFWGSLPLAVAAGADFPYFLYQLLVENQKTFPQNYTSNLYCRSTTEDFYWIYDEITSHKPDNKNRSEFMKKTVVELFNIVLLRECNDTLVLDDPKPGVKEITSLVLHQISSLERKLRTRLQSAKISRKVRSRQFKRAVLHAVNILFICRGNICRSPFAERYSRNTLPKNLQISSCGYIRQNGREPPPEATSAAIKYGVNLSDHQAHEVTEEMLQNSDMIIVFDESNFRILADRYKDYKRKIWFLSEICPDLPLFIEDPFRKNGESCEKVYSVIGYCIDEINHWLKENSS